MARSRAVIGVVAAPWAVDANGNPVDTHYEVRGSTLSQVIEFDAGTAFPVVADPDFIFFAKCTAAVVLFAAENAVAVANRLGTEVSKLSGLNALFQRCTP